ncbi:hypothetical protein Tsubulata_027726 [Turnera subulata]|uniref:WRKY domain-containing protein n=1 Tax=Turnera subulata TaxID=218843 RepID=A0A9Q0F1S6_9ROSI|nr:hypothetical protein Tsubulata_027726 [Turnera subulata]
MSGNEQDQQQQPPPSPTASSSSTAGPWRPTITLPPRASFAESLFSSSSSAAAGPGSGLGFSPGPMTLLSSFFSDSDDCKSFSQLLAGAMASPGNTKTPPPPFSDQQKPSSAHGSLTVAPPPPPPMFAMTSGLLDSPGLSLFSPQGSYGMSHQQVLAQVTAQAAHSSSLSLFSSSSAPNSSAHQQYSLPESGVEARESSDFSHSDLKLEASSSSIIVDKPGDDGYNWRKYGQKQVKGSEFPRSYYKCTHPSCPVKKKVERSLEGQVTEIIYKGQHNHQPPPSNKRAKDSGGINGTTSVNHQGTFEVASHSQGGNGNRFDDRKDQESSQATREQVSGTSDGEEVGDTETGADDEDQDEPDAKRRNTTVRVTEPAPSHRTVTEPRIIVQTTSEVDLLDDGYRWRKYGQKVVKGNPYPRSYYKCTGQGCKVRKHVERAAADPKAVITTYEGKHNHDVPVPRGSSSHNTANANATQPKPQDMERYAMINSNTQQPIARLRLKEEQIT